MSKILIVDDNIKNLQVLANTLADVGYEIEYAQNGHVITSYSIHYTKLYDLLFSLSPLISWERIWLANKLKIQLL